MDRPGDDPWEDLWFYSNPIFIDLVPSAGLSHVGQPDEQKAPVRDLGDFSRAFASRFP